MRAFRDLEKGSDPLRAARDFAALQRVRPLFQIRAIDLYRRAVLKCDEPVLEDILTRLAEIAEAERRSGADRSGSGPAAGMPGPLDPNEPQIIRQVRTEIRLRHYSIRTEDADVGWIVRFLKANDSADAAGLGENEVKEFLSSLAVDRNVAASTQNQAFSASNLKPGRSWCGKAREIKTG